MRRIFSLASILYFSLAFEVHAEQYQLPPNGGSIIGQLIIVSAQDEDTFLKLGRRFDIGFEELVIANPKVDPWLPGEGTQIVIPTRYILPNTKREGMVLNLAEMRLYYYPKSSNGKSEFVYTYPISIGRDGWTTPHSQTRIITKAKNPIWYPPESVKIAPSQSMKLCNPLNCSNNSIPGLK